MLELITNLFITIILPLLVTYIVTILKIEINKKNKILLIENATDIVFDAVIKTTQTYVDNIKKGAAFDAKNQKKALAITKETARTLINDATKRVITQTFGDFEEWLDTKIEVAVKQTKKEGK